MKEHPMYKQPYREFMALTAAVLCLALTPAALAQPSGHAAHGNPVVSVDAVPSSTAGEVRRIDLANQKITLRHEEITHLNMPPMTMVFKVRDKSLLNNLSVGDGVRFVAIKQGGEYWVTEMQRTP
jgi:Cu(I)/Ag(I) efflux system protein CusF